MLRIVGPTFVQKTHHLGVLTKVNGRDVSQMDYEERIPRTGEQHMGIGICVRTLKRIEQCSVSFVLRFPVFTIIVTIVTS